MNNNVKCYMLLFIVIALQGCATLGDAYKSVDFVPKDKSLVYIYRPSSFVGGAISYHVYANDKIITKLYNGGYFPYITKPGKIRFSAKTEASSSVDLLVEAGKTYYLKGGVTMGIIVGRPVLSIVSAKIGRSEIKGCRYIPKKNWEEIKMEKERKRMKMIGL